MTPEEKEEQSLWSAPAWFSLGTYNKGDVVRYGEALYQCLESHYGEASWSPPESPNLWKRIR